MKISIEASNTMMKNLAASSRSNESGSAKSEFSTHQIRNDTEASKALGTNDAESLANFKEFVKGYDFTSITQKELAEISIKLYNNNLIDLETAGHLILGDANFNADGTQIIDTKFNALELFSSNLEGQKKWASSATSVEGIYNSRAEVAKTNKAVGVLFSLAYFSNSNAFSIGVNEKT